MTHDEFVARAQETARNAQGLRPLAGHVRRLYRDIRALQGDDNAFYYISEVIHAARGGDRDLSQTTERVKTYFHRYRKALGDPVVARGLDGGTRVRRAALDQRSTGTAPGSPSSPTRSVWAPDDPHAPHQSDGVEDRTDLRLEQAAPGVPESPLAHDPASSGLPSPPKRAVPERTAPEHSDMAALAACYRRPGRRRLISGG
ncbi:hypothetical protein [Pelagibacterium montanilacus]|uniref:hypothetical protein n=1 Tax=Pelagibacterium montanilacus TaxID=2185280 RepID=UPI000F8E250D|nr:hypothetical protein [Pelagibacterium montanilacus]